MSGRKVSKASVRYRPVSQPIIKWSPRTRRCGNCSMFQFPASCTLVAGIIKRNDVCDKWEAKR